MRSGLSRRAAPMLVLLAVGALSSSLAEHGAAAPGGKEPLRPGARPVSLVDRTAAFVPRELLVRFRAGTSASSRASALSEHGATVKRRLPVPDLSLVVLPPGKSVRAVVTALEARADVLYAEPNMLYHATAAPNDPRYANGELWGLHQSSDADIDAPEAWDTTTGDAGVVVAVVDTGVAYDHPDLAPNIWSNPGEAADGIDNDGNGKVDDLRGWDFQGNGSQEDNDPRDVSGHGTHVAGTIGAQGNDATGVVGVNWDVSIMPVRVLGPEGGSNAAVTAGFAYAAQEGAKVVNASLGCSGAGCFSQAMKDAIDAAPNTLFVVAAGNNGDNNESTPTYPCNYASANLVCVAATTKTDAVADFSNYGTTAVDLAAPGTEIVSAWPATSSVGTEDFETLLAGRWATGGVQNTWARHAEGSATGSWGITDSPGVPYVNSTDSWIATVTPMSLAGRDGCLVRYSLALDTEWDYDYLLVEGSTNNATWTTAAAWTGVTNGYPATKWTFEDDLSLFDGAATFYLRFALLTDTTVVEDGARIDAVDVRCASSTYGPTDYNSIQGTSMATPHAAGVAALAWAKNPRASVAAVKAALLNGGDVVPALDGKVASERRLNAAGTLALIPPAVAPPPLACIGAAATAGAPTIRGHTAAPEYVFWRTAFWHWSGTAWERSLAPWLFSAATAGAPASEWRRLDTGALVGTTSTVTQALATSPPGGFWTATAEVVWLSTALQVTGYDQVLVPSASGASALPGTPVCSWPSAAGAVAGASPVPTAAQGTFALAQQDGDAAALGRAVGSAALRGRLTPAASR